MNRGARRSCDWALGGALVVALGVALSAPRTVPAQTFPPDEVGPGGWMLERLARERWRHGAQRARSTPHASTEDRLTIDSIVPSSGGARALHVTLGRRHDRRDSAQAVLDPRNRVLRVAVGRAPLDREFAMVDGALRLDESPLAGAARLWDVAPPMPAGGAAALRVGARWTETLAREAREGTSVVEARGPRFWRVVGDSVVGGRRLWILRDSAELRLRERSGRPSRTLGTIVTLTRTGRGVVRGRSLFDPALGLLRERADTAVWAGEAVLAYPDGRSFRTPAAYDGTRSWRLHDADDWALRRRARIDSLRRRRGGQVMPLTPLTALQERMTTSPRVADSVLGAWRATQEPDAYRRLGRELARVIGAERVDSLRVADGDSALLVEQLVRRSYGGRRPLGASDARLLVGYLADPGRLVALGVGEDPPYEDVVQGLYTHPPAAITDSAEWACDPAACLVLAGAWTTAREPRLRDVALVAHVALDPARWADTLLASSRRATPVLREMTDVVRGVGATWPVAVRRPLPPPDADWRVWRRWMLGLPDADAISDTVTWVRDARAASPRSLVRFDASHEIAIRMASLVQRRDVVGELRRAYVALDAAAPGAARDSARAVLGTVLRGVGALRLDAGELAAVFRSRDAGRLPLARAAVWELFRAEQGRWDERAAWALQDRLVAIVLEDAAPWPELDPAAAPRAGWERPRLHARPVPGTRMLDPAGLADAVLASWRSRFPVADDAAWRARSLRAPGVRYSFDPVRRVGPFVHLSARAAERLARPDDAEPALNASAVSYVLLEVDGVWTVVAWSAMIT